jgi:hypothetical protein
MTTNNNRAVEDPRLQKALDEAVAVFGRYGFAGAVILISPAEAAFAYRLHAPWSAFRFDNTTPLGWYLRAVERETGRDETRRRVEGAAHTICQLSDFGEQMLRRAGIQFDHTSFGGNPLSHLIDPASDGDGPAAERAPPEPPVSGGANEPIAAMWASLERRVLPPEAGFSGRQQARTFFFLGGAALFRTIMDGLDSCEEVTDGDMTMMDKISAELQRFIVSVPTGIL